MKYLMARSSPCVFPNPNSNGFEVNNSGIQENGPSTDSVQSNAAVGLHKFGNTIAFEYLNIPLLPFDLDSTEVVISFCEILVRLYKALLSERYYRYTVYL